MEKLAALVSFIFIFIFPITFTYFAYSYFSQWHNYISYYIIYFTS